MAQSEITDIVKQYVEAVRMAGVPVSTAILFGSYAHNTAHADSDIDVFIVCPVFDEQNKASVDLLWELRATTDARIEPVACGQKQWEDDQQTWLMQIARQEGIVIA